MEKSKGFYVLLILAFAALLWVAGARGPAWATEKADLIVVTGDIDNLGFGWEEGFDMFSGDSTPSLDYNFTPEADDPPGTDRIMVGTSYTGESPTGQDGYTDSSARPDNFPQAIVMNYNLTGIQVSSAVLQIFANDFQAPVFQSEFQVTLNGQRAPFLEGILNSLDQTGAGGKIITAQVPQEYLPLIAGGSLEIYIDDPVTGAGDGFAIDFVRLLINPGAQGNGGSGIIVLQIDNPFMTVNGADKEIDPGKGTVPLIMNGRTLVPIRAIIEAMGGTINWDGEAKKVTVQLKGNNIELWIGENTTLVNGNSKTTDVPPQIINERTMLPLRFISENLGCNVKWNGDTSEITIKY